MNKAIYHAKEDPVYAAPFVDRGEMRVRVMPDGSQTTFRLIHGGFENTSVKFSFFYPEKECFSGRFFQYLSPFPGPDEELASMNKAGEDDIIAFCLENGAYFVETNMGASAVFTNSPDQTIVYKSSAAAATRHLPASRIQMRGTAPYRM